jgi:hypothetical protein
VARTPDINKAIESTVTRAVRAEVALELRRLEKQLTRISDRLRSVRVVGRGVAATNGKPKGAVSPGRRLHGRYIGLLRHLPKKQQVRVRSIRHKRGVHAAIKAAEQFRK